MHAPAFKHHHLALEFGVRGFAAKQDFSKVPFTQIVSFGRSPFCGFRFGGFALGGECGGNKHLGGEGHQWEVSELLHN